MKRARADSSSSPTASKVQKLAPIFQRPVPAADAPFRWHPSQKEAATLLHGTHLAPPANAKVALFDLDGTLIESSYAGGRGKGKVNPFAWKWWHPVVPRKLAELIRDGYAIVLISNQGIKSDKLTDWKKKIPLIAAAIREVPFHIYAATGRDGFRKPMPGMLYELERRTGVSVDPTASFFVGDAAGRAGDFASTDRKWALNTGVPFFTPEEYFLGLQPAPYTLPGFHVSSLPLLEPVPTPSASLAKLSISDLTSEAPSQTASIEEILPSSLEEVAPDPAPTPELVLFVGPPAIGKTSHYGKHFAPRGYAHVNQDTLGTRQKCLSATRAALSVGTSAVVDNTNRDAGTRSQYVRLSKELGVPIRCVLFAGSVDLARHNNLYRAYIAPPPRRAALPELALTTFRAAYEEPTLGEGFAALERVHFVFEGSEEERRRWGMWLSVDK